MNFEELIQRSYKSLKKTYEEDQRKFNGTICHSNHGYQVLDKFQRKLELLKKHRFNL